MSKNKGTNNRNVRSASARKSATNGGIVAKNSIVGGLVKESHDRFTCPPRPAPGPKK